MPNVAVYWRIVRGAIDRKGNASLPLPPLFFAARCSHRRSHCECALDTHRSHAGGILQRPSIASALQAERPLVTPLAHDALSVRLIARAGFRAFTIGGSARLAARVRLPDTG